MLAIHHKFPGQSATINIAISGNRITCSIKIKCKGIKNNYIKHWEDTKFIQYFSWNTWGGGTTAGMILSKVFIGCVCGVGSTCSGYSHVTGSCNESSGSINGRKFLDQPRDYVLIKDSILCSQFIKVNKSWIMLGSEYVPFLLTLEPVVVSMGPDVPFQQCSSR